MTDIELRITPFKTINPPRHFSQRYFHKYAPLDDITGLITQG